MKWKLAAMLVIGFVLGLATSFVATQPEAAAQEKKKAKAQRWEYRVTAHSFGLGPQGIDPNGVSNASNALANDGWEYVGPVSQNQQGFLVIFKRLQK